MTGLLHRLARETVSPEPTRLHATVRPLFAPPQDTQPASEAMLDDIRAWPDSTAGPQSTNEIANSPSTAASPATTTGASASITTSHTPPAAHPTSKSVFPHDAPSSSELNRGDPDSERKPQSPDLQPPDRFEGHLEINARAPLHPTFPRSRMEEAIDEAPSIMPPADTADFRIPPLLVAPSAEIPDISQDRPSAHFQPQSHKTGDHQPTSAPQDNEPTEVHVHIGRIEVTAITEPAPAPAKPRRGKPTMSLEEYLAKRQQERP